MSISTVEIAEGLQRELARRLFGCQDFVRAFGKSGESRLFPARSSAAIKALDTLAARGYVEIVEPEAGELQCRLTVAGRKWVLEVENPKVLLEDCLRVWESQSQLLEKLSAEFAALRAQLSSQSAVVSEVLAAVENDAASRRVDEALLRILGDVRSVPSLAAFDLKSLYDRSRNLIPGLTIGQFHDVVRSLHGQGRIRLSPWTGPLYQLPEPSLALLIGHEVLYYVELQRSVAA